MHNYILPSFLLLIAFTNLCIAQQASTIVFEDSNGHLRYVADAENNYIPDFSYAGYKNGEAPIPEVPVVKTISAIEGDNTAHIQAALDEIGALPMDENGLRGALLLEAGTYDIQGTLVIRESGVVLRGVGDSSDPANNTILLGIGNSPANRDLIQVGNTPNASWSKSVPGTHSVVTSDFVPAGSRSLKVAAPELFSEGNNVIIHHASTQEWLASVNFGDTDVDAPWSPGEIDIVYNRYITAVDFEESKITLDAPIYDHLDRSLSVAEVYVLNKEDLRQNIGVENLRIDIQTAGESDENHAYNAIRLIGVEDCWVQQITALHFVYAAVDTRAASRVTVRDCQGLAPHSEITGARRYNFAAGHLSNNILFENCFATEGRHSFVSNGASTVSGIVFYNCQSQTDYSSSEGHRRWSQGLLFDNITFSRSQTNTLLGLYNRGSFGTGHGWSAVHSVAWGVKVPLSRNIKLQKPPGRQNYAIACPSYVTNLHNFPHPKGYEELSNQTPLIPSLYVKQLQTRLGLGIPPDGPAMLEAKWMDGQVLLHWLDIAARETAYHVELSTDGGASFTTIADLPADADSFIHTELAPYQGSELIYRVYASGHEGPSPYSNTAQIDPLTSTEVEPVPKLKVSPNPVRDTLYLEADAESLNVQVFNALGSLIAQEQQVKQIDTSHWVNGTYYLRISDKTGKSSLIKIIKQ